MGFPTGTREFLRRNGESSGLNRHTDFSASLSRSLWRFGMAPKRLGTRATNITRPPQLRWMRFLVGTTAMRIGFSRGHEPLTEGEPRAAEAARARTLFPGVFLREAGRTCCRVYVGECPAVNALTAGGMAKPAEMPDVFSPHFRGTEMPGGIVWEGTVLNSRRLSAERL